MSIRVTHQIEYANLPIFSITNVEIAGFVKSWLMMEKYGPLLYGICILY